jgi:hypothetical protein
VSSDLERIEQIIDASGVAGELELMLPVGVRPRQLQVRTLLIAMTLAIRAGRKAFLTAVHKTLRELPADQQQRLGVIADWRHGEHTLSYRQVEYTFRLVSTKLAKDEPDGTPSELLQDVLDRLLEASVQVLGEPPSHSYAIDWTDHETWSLPPPKKPAADSEPTTAADPDPSQPSTAEPPPTQPEQPPNPDCADPEAAWGRRRRHAPGDKDELFFGYYLQAATIVKDEHSPELPELARRMRLTSCDHDPPPAFVPVLQRMHAAGIKIGDVLVDSGYSYRTAARWALPLRTLGIDLIQDLHPNDRGPHGTHHGAIINNGNLYCPATPTTLLELGPLPRGATPEHTTAHDTRCHELHRYKLSPITGYDPDGYRRVSCPAAQGKIRCPLRPASMTLSHDRPQVLTPPQHPPICCTQKTITVPPTINAKTAQKHDYPSPEHRRSYNRRTAAERTFATVKDPATTDISRGWCRLMGLAPIALFTAAALITRNIRIADAFTARQAENQRRAAHGLPPKRRTRRRQTTEDLIRTAHAPP